MRESNRARARERLRVRERGRERGREGESKRERGRLLLWQGSADDAVDLFVDVGFGQTVAAGVVGHADGHRLGVLGVGHRDLKELQTESGNISRTKGSQRFSQQQNQANTVCVST